MGIRTFPYLKKNHLFDCSQHYSNTRSASSYLYKPHSQTLHLVLDTELTKAKHSISSLYESSSSISFILFTWYFYSKLGIYNAMCYAQLAQLCLTLCDPMDCRLTGSSVHGDSQARILEWVATPSSRGSSQPRDQTQVFRIAGRFFTV